MADILIASDASWVIDELRAAVEGPSGPSSGGRVADTTVRAVPTGDAVAPAMAEHTPDLVVLDLQIGNMGGMATCVHLRLEAEAGRLPEVPVLMLLDRRADVFLARRSGADGWLVKPLDPLRVRRAVTAILDGGVFEDPTGAPPPVPGPAAVG